ncbi:hypothetical protein CCYA_CCYA06G1805 [Cyanidiococcus yangmingshanensis]|nr:hypothetical protein CCYA_CCYA06G1805 [Cyanidiococcus yangmingshanensis]
MFVPHFAFNCLPFPRVSLAYGGGLTWATRRVSAVRAGACTRVRRGTLWPRRDVRLVPRDATRSRPRSSEYLHDYALASGEQCRRNGVYMAAPHEEASRPPNFDDPKWLPEYDKDFMEARVLALNEHGACWLLILQPFLTPSYVLPMFIGDTEAQAIQNARTGQKPSRPSTHDLAKSALEACNIRVIRVAVTHVLGGSFVARIWLRAEGAFQEVNVDSRPSDAIALALRFKVPIWVRRQVLFSSGSPIEKYFAVRSSGPEESERSSTGAGNSSRKMRSLFDPRPVISPDDPILNPPQTGMSSKTILAFFRNHSPFKTEAVQKLERELKESIAREDYLEAARIRDELRRLYPLDIMREEIRKAIEDQRFDDAARIRDEIIAWKLEHDPQIPAPSEWRPDLDISSGGTRDPTNLTGLQSGESNETQQQQQQQQPKDSEEGPEESAM